MEKLVGSYDSQNCKLGSVGSTCSSLWTYICMYHCISTHVYINSVCMNMSSYLRESRETLSTKSKLEKSGFGFRFLK